MTGSSAGLSIETFETSPVPADHYLIPVSQQLDVGFETEVGAPDMPAIADETHDFAKKSFVSYFSDGSAVRAPRPMSVREWKAMPTSAGTTIEWDGVVVAVKEDAFEARLQNLKGASAKYEEVAEFEIEAVPAGDRDLLRPGGIFRWVVGYESQSGTRHKYSKIVFRRLPAWTQRSLENSVGALQQTVAEIKWR